MPEEQQILGAELGAVDAQARIEELVASNAELRRQIEATRAHAEELAAIKESLAKEVRCSDSRSGGDMHRPMGCMLGWPARPLTCPELTALTSLLSRALP